MNSKLYICNGINLDRHYNNVLSYTESEMLSLCQTNAINSASNFNFIKQGKNEVEVPFTYQQCLQANYMCFQNPNYSNKWFFAFIDSCEFRSPGTTRIKFTIDVFSTWYDYWDAKSCFVMREHVSDDTIGLHTLDEGLDYGDYIINVAGEVETDLQRQYLICIGVSWLPDNTPFYSEHRIYGGVYSGLSYLLFKFTESASKFVKAMSELGHAGDIVNLFMLPIVVCEIGYDDARWTIGSLGDETGINFALLPNNHTAVIIRNDITLTSPSTLNGYTPKNNKLFCYPYNALTITNNVGTQAIYKYEDFINNTPIFNLVGTPSPSGSIWLYPGNYKKNASGGYNYGMPVAKYPMGSWLSDQYTNWMTQNGVNIFGTRINAADSQALMGSLQALTGAGTLNIEGIATGIGNMLGATQSLYHASMIPNQIGGQINSGDIQYAYNKMSPTYYKMSIREEYARIIDDFFSRYGYKINRVKVPNQISRTYWNFIQIGSSEIIGYPNSKNYGIPKDDMESINNIYRRGVTIWHNHANIGNFSLSNSITT